MQHEMESDPDPSVLMRTAAQQVDRLNKAVSRYRVFSIILGVVCAALIVGGLVLWNTYGQTRAAVSDTRSTVSQLKGVESHQVQESYDTCVEGNTYREGDQKIWTHVLTLATRGNPDANAISRSLLAYIAQVDALRNCKPLLSGGG
jgi:hypothetical protein